MTAPATGALRGECLCGAVAYEVDDAFDYALNCHCSRCRRATGSAFKPLGGIRRGRLRLVRGDDRLLVYGDPEGAHDLRCATCGSLLWSVVREGRWIHVALGSLLDAPSLRPTHHIMVGSKAPWFTITDDLPQFEKFD